MPGIGGDYTFCETCDLLYHDRDCPCCEARAELETANDELGSVQAELDDAQSEVVSLEERLDSANDEIEALKEASQ